MFFNATLIEPINENEQLIPDIARAQTISLNFKAEVKLAVVLM